MPNGIPISIRECKRFRRGRVQYLGGGSNSDNGSNQICCLQLPRSKDHRMPADQGRRRRGRWWQWGDLLQRIREEINHKIQISQKGWGRIYRKQRIVSRGGAVSRGWICNSIVPDQRRRSRGGARDRPDTSRGGVLVARWDQWTSWTYIIMVRKLACDESVLVNLGLWYQVENNRMS